MEFWSRTAVAESADEKAARQEAEAYVIGRLPTVQRRMEMALEVEISGDTAAITKHLAGRQQQLADSLGATLDAAVARLDAATDRLLAERRKPASGSGAGRLRTIELEGQGTGGIVV